MTVRTYGSGAVAVHLGDCLDVLRALPDASVHAVVTDPPYELGFMGRAWDATGIAYSVELWRECLRVLKPGGHLLAFGGTRTYHRLACAIEDAGFEIRDSISWLYGSGFPKSMDISKAIDKAFRRDYVLAAVELGLSIPGNNLHDWTKAEHSPGDAWWEKFKAHIPAADWQRIERKVIGTGYRVRNPSDVQVAGLSTGAFTLTAAATDASRQWEGWGTTLKPAHEPIVVARKPLAGTVAANVMQHGAGGLNIDGCRVPTAEDRSRPPRTPNAIYGGGKDTSLGASEPHAEGRWPTNLLLSHSALLDEHGEPVGDACADGCAPGCAVAELDGQSARPFSRRGKPRAGAHGSGWGMTATGAEYDDEGGPSRFFPVFRYQSKAPARERPKTADGTAHPTVKPLALMRWLVRLVTPPGGTVLDPFAGSGTTAEACALEGFGCVAAEKDPQYLPLIEARLTGVLPPDSTGPRCNCTHCRPKETAE